MNLRGLLLSIFLAPLASAELKVVSLHPLIGDLLRQVGGDKIEVIDLIGANGDPHSFEPQAKDLAAAESAEIYFVSGMELETYLPELKTVLGDRARIVEVGSTLPSLHGACNHEGHEHNHEHEIDPHWWHSIDLFRRAAGIVEVELSKQSPEDAATFATNAAAYRGELDELEKWVKREVIRIPRDARKLATAHAAFQYFCEAYGFESFSVQGLNREQMPDAVTLAKLIATLEEEKVAAIFPEKESNPKMLQSLTRDTGIKLGGELIADGRGVTSYKDMMRANVTAIVAGLSK
ncbi:MAG: metal ABC transporter substrate-binding protein [Akkermansiaceae bacterium]|jgi:zinc/manganese transport system substrate-binding protein|nr:metal ABC transporter substrate-binding protein [Akkermansiaceae bacterium]MDP4647985.1 metal ABC transporter substrate-binding protein [Akkermansiaceae bacterium]MDP4719776.1 metal ABC transporter substrate-binding protein [Akkermansiaceae bacterium]MDP4781332.1 metal ABC transporter substrate-binding protein [Akkermansiaceae bacterium]MDP4846087.1 metal ABC transporter substrate-binding protein [Akkermansiaceae bacterium]